MQTEFDSTVIFTTNHQQHHYSLHHRPKHTPIRNQPLGAVPVEPISTSPWTSFATLSLVISHMSVPQFAPGMSLEECLRDREKRQEAVTVGRFTISVEFERSEVWPSGVREALEMLRGKGRFVMTVRGDGADIEKKHNARKVRVRVMKVKE